MPLWLRRTTFNLMKEYYDKQNEETNEQKNIINNKTPQVLRPNISPPDYTTRAAKE